VLANASKNKDRGEYIIIPLCLAIYFVLMRYGNMAKNITVTNIDGLDIGEKHNMEPRQKKKMIHEQLFEQYGINPNKVFEKTGILKMIPNEWIPDIIIFNVKNCKTKRTYENINKNEKVISVSFESADDCQKFYDEFNLSMSKSVNAFIVSQKEDPKRYNRIIVIETSTENQQINFRY
jgi:hypothetical protein